MKNSFIDGYISHGQILFGADKCTHVAKGYALNMPALENASQEQLDQIQEELRPMLRSLGGIDRLQFHWSTASDYSEELLAYYGETCSTNPGKWPKRQRNERFTRYWEAMERGRLRRDRLHVYLTRPIDIAGADMDQLLRTSAQGFATFENELRQMAGRVGGRVRPLDDDKLFLEYHSILSPSLPVSKDLEFDPSKTLMENCFGGDMSPVENPEAGFYLDGYYHGLLALRSLPQSTCMGIAVQLTGLPLNGCTITTNITPLDSTVQIARIEAEANKLRTALARRDDIRMRSSLEYKQEKISRLMSNSIQPYQVQILICVRDKDRQNLQQKLSALKAAVVRMQSAKPMECSFPTTARNLFRASLPGWIFDKYTDGSHYIEDINLTHLLPVPSGADLSGKAESIYDGAVGNLIAINGFGGQPGNEFPKHMMVVGQTGGGKSMLLNDWLSQSDPYYDFTVIVDDGFSYETFARTIDPQIVPIIMDPKGNKVTLNYLDTKGEPLGSGHVADAVAVTSRMAGLAPSDPAESVLTRCLYGFYEDCYQDWRDSNPSKFQSLTREAVALHQFAQRHRQTTLAAWQDFNMWEKYDAGESEESRQSITKEDISRYFLREEARDELFRLAYARMTPQEMPTHSDFQQWLELESLGDSPDKETIGRLATGLEPWCRDRGRYGGLFDGVNTVSYDGRLVYIELGGIPESASELRAMAAFVITNHIRNEIMRRPRGRRKRVLLEELGAFLSIPGGAQIAKDFYERLRKHDGLCISVIQNPGDVGKNDALQSIVANSRQAILLGQSSRDAVDGIAKSFRLPDIARDSLLRFPEPSKATGAMFLHCDYSGESPVIRTGCNIAHPEMLYLASSRGKDHDKRSEELRDCECVVEEIINRASESQSRRDG